MGNALKSNTKVLGLFSIVMITISSVDNIRNLPATALFGAQLPFFFLFGLIFFLIPTALVSAELSSMWSKPGGVYLWVKEAFGSKWGFLAIWMQWVENVFWYPTVLSFVAATLGYLINPALISNKVFILSVILTAFWGVTFINWFGMRSSVMFTTLCGIAGLGVPMALIIGLGATWYLSGNPLQLDISAHAMVPHVWDPNVWISLTAIVFSFTGMEIATVHADDVKNPQKVYPRALLISTLFIATTLLFGALAIAIVVPVKEISLVAGIVQAYHNFFAAYHMNWILPWVVIFLIAGVMGGVNNWVIAPTRGLLAAAQDGHLPPVFQKLNRHGAPTTMLITQAVIVTVVSLSFLLIPSVNGSYWLLSALASQLYMIMYMVMFSAAIYLRYKLPNHERQYKIPGGNVGMWIVSSVGIFGSFITLLIGFIPPSHFALGSLARYEGLLIVGLLLMSIPPFLTSKSQKDTWFAKA